MSAVRLDGRVAIVTGAGRSLGPGPARDEQKHQSSQQATEQNASDGDGDG